MFTRVARSGRATFMYFEKSMRSLYIGRELGDVWSHGGRCKLRCEGRKEESNSRKGREERERESLNSLGTLSIIRIKSGRYAFLKKLFAKNFKGSR